MHPQHDKAIDDVSDQHVKQVMVDLSQPLHILPPTLV
jgi:hypothetical protein